MGANQVNLPENPLVRMILDLLLRLRGTFGWKKALAGACIGAGASIVFAIMQPNEYRSEAKLLPSQGSANEIEGGLLTMAAAAGIDIGGGSRGRETLHVEILRSRWMAENLLKHEYTYSYRNSYFGVLHSEKGTLATYFHARNLDEGVRALGTAMGVARDQKTGVVSLAFLSKSPELSHQVVARAVESLDVFLREKLQTGGSNRMKFIESRIVDAQREYDAAGQRFTAFVQSNLNYMASQDPKTRVQGMRLEGELNLRRQLLTSLFVSREKALLDAKNDIPNLTVMDAASLPQQKSKPNRGKTVIYATFLAFLLVWSIDNRRNLLQAFQKSW